MRRQAGVLGSPIAHSRSPILHQAAYAALGLDWAYQAYEVTPSELAAFIDGCDESWIGLSLTMPLKVEVLALLDDMTPIARTARAVNTVTFVDGRMLGDNTDVHAFTQLIGRADAEAVVLGAGATARSAVVALQLQGVEHMTCWARKLSAAKELAAFAESLGMRADAISGPAQSGVLMAPIVVSALPGDAARDWANMLVDIPPGRLVDVAYDPWPPPLTHVWPNGQRISGLDLLLEQAARQIEQWSGASAPRAAMRAALLSTGEERRVDELRPRP